MAKGKVDVPVVLLRMQHILHSIGPAASDDAADLRKARFAVAELIEAAGIYANDYMQDEADGSAYVCGDEQRNAAQRVFRALSALRSSQGGREGDEGEGKDEQH